MTTTMDWQLIANEADREGALDNTYTKAMQIGDAGCLVRITRGTHYAAVTFVPGVHIEFSHTNGQPYYKIVADPDPQVTYEMAERKAVLWAERADALKPK